MSELRFYDIQDGEDTILLTDGEAGTFADREDFVGPGPGPERMWGRMKMLGATMPLERIEEKEAENGHGRDTWIEVDARGNPV